MRGLWVSEAVTLAAVTSGLEGMSVRHGLKEGGKSPYGLNHMAGNAAEWVSDWYDRTTIKTAQRRIQPARHKVKNGYCVAALGRIYRWPCV